MSYNKRKKEREKERREELKKAHKCVVCGADLPVNCEFVRCFKCRLRQTQADKKYREKEKIIKYLKSLVLDAESVGSKFTAGIDVRSAQKIILIMKRGNRR